MNPCNHMTYEEEEEEDIYQYELACSIFGSERPDIIDSIVKFFSDAHVDDAFGLVKYARKTRVINWYESVHMWRSALENYDLGMLCTFQNDSLDNQFREGRERCLSQLVFLSQPDHYDQYSTSPEQQLNSTINIRALDVSSTKILKIWALYYSILRSLSSEDQLPTTTNSLRRRDRLSNFFRSRSFSSSHHSADLKTSLYLRIIEDSIQLFRYCRDCPLLYYVGFSLYEILFQHLQTNQDYIKTIQIHLYKLSYNHLKNLYYSGDILGAMYGLKKLIYESKECLKQNKKSIELTELIAKMCVRSADWSSIDIWRKTGVKHYANMDTIASVVSQYEEALSINSKSNRALRGIGIAYFKNLRVNESERRNSSRNTTLYSSINSSINVYRQSIDCFFRAVQIKFSHHDFCRLLNLWLNVHMFLPLEMTSSSASSSYNSSFRSCSHVNIFHDYISKLPIQYFISVFPQLIARIDCSNSLSNQSASQTGNASCLPCIDDCIIEILVKVLSNIQSLSEDDTDDVCRSILYGYLSCCNAKHVSIKQNQEALSCLYEKSRQPLYDCKLFTLIQTNIDLFQPQLILFHSFLRIASISFESFFALFDDVHQTYMSTSVKSEKTSIMNDLKLEIDYWLSQPPKCAKDIQFNKIFGNQLQTISSSIHDAIMMDNSSTDAIYSDIWKDHILPLVKKINNSLGSLKQLKISSVIDINTMNFLTNFRLFGSTISTFEEKIKVIPTKTRPKKLKAICSDSGKTIKVLLKTNEDLRQDSVLMQLLNVLQSSTDILSVTTYGVCPVNSTVGVIEWVNNFDTTHKLVMKQRQRNNNTQLFHEINLMNECFGRNPVNLSKHCQNLQYVIHRVEALKYALANTSGDDLIEPVLNVNTIRQEKLNNNCIEPDSMSLNSWLNRRIAYTRSLAVMSVIGYIIGLGDRHPSNLLISRASAKVLHIDFGDCFETATYRHGFPEDIPFRLTRMLIMPLGVVGVQGGFITTCENVLNILRVHRDLVISILEALVFDPILSWKLLPEKDRRSSDSVKHRTPKPTSHSLNLERRMSHRKTMLQSCVIDPSALLRLAEIDSGGNNNILKNRALYVIERVHEKLTGQEFTESVHSQVKRIIAESTSVFNLSRLYYGWCPFW